MGGCSHVALDDVSFLGSITTIEAHLPPFAVGRI